jgi:hypothetical protein
VCESKNIELIVKSHRNERKRKKEIQLLTLDPRDRELKLPIWLYFIINDKRSCDIEVDASLIFGSGDNFSVSPFSVASASSSA